MQGPDSFRRFGPRRLKVILTQMSNLQPLRVPDRHVAAFESVRDMEDGLFGQVLGALNSIQPTTRRSSLIESLRGESALPVEDIGSILDALMGLAGVGYRSQEAPEIVAERAAASTQIRSSDDAREKLASRLSLLLSSDVVRLQSKALLVGGKYERIFLGTQILTDLRPIFESDLQDSPEPEGALLVHTLNLHFVGSDGRHDDFFLALDDSDVESLLTALSRAQQKSAALRQTLERAGLIHMTMEE